jgi:hypothetical protein
MTKQVFEPEPVAKTNFVNGGQNSRHILDEEGEEDDFSDDCSGFEDFSAEESEEEPSGNVNSIIF